MRLEHFSSAINALASHKLAAVGKFFFMRFTARLRSFHVLRLRRAKR
jgi:hypothetical protein